MKPIAPQQKKNCSQKVYLKHSSLVSTKQDIVDEVKCSDEERTRYMKLYGVIDYEKRDSYEAGHEAKLIELVCRKIAKGKNLSLIAEELEEDESTIKKIYDAAMSVAPDFDATKIYHILHTK